MSLEIILGPKSKGKSECLYNKIQEDLKNNDDILLFVPSQKRAVVENEYMEFLNLDGILNLNVTTLDQYIKEILKISNMHIDDKYLNEIDKKMLIFKLISDNKELFRKYKKVSDKDGFILEIVNYIETLRGLNIENVDDIDKIKNIEFESGLTKSKFIEILDLYKKYLEELNKKEFLDDTSYINIYNKIISNNEKLPKKIYFDGYNNFKKVELEIINMYLKNNIDIVISIVTDAKCIEDVARDNTSEIFEISNRTYQDLLKLAAKNGVEVYEKYVDYVDNKPEDLQKLAIYNFSYNENLSVSKCNNIKINLVKNEKSEICQVAESIIESIKKGKKFSDNVIFMTDIGKYENIIKQVFYEYNIPYYIDKKIMLYKNILIKYFLNFVNLSLEFNISKVIETLKLGLCDIQENKILNFENYVIEYNIHILEKEFKYNSKNKYDLEEINNTRENILNIFKLKDLDINKNYEVKKYIEAVYQNLLQNKIFDKYIEYVNCVTDYNKKQELSQVLNKLNEIVDSISKIYKDTEISFEEFVKVINLIIKDTTLKTVPNYNDQVLILDINSSKISYKDNVYIIGANEEEFPKLPKEDVIFSDIELEQIENKCGIKIKENVNSKYNMSLYNIYEVFTIPLELIEFYYKSSEMSGKALSISKVLENIKDTFDIEVIGNVLDDDKYNVLNNKNLVYQMLEEKEEIKKASIYEYLSGTQTFSNILEWKKIDKNLEKNTLDLLYKDKIKSSVTRLEEFKKCPFSYYLKYVVDVKKREEFEPTSLEIGSFMHEVIEEFSFFILKNNISWRQLHQKFELDECKNIEIQIEKIVSSKIDKYLSKQENNVRFNILKQRLLSNIKAILRVISLSFSQSEFEPYGYEIEFNEKSAFAPIVIQTKDNKQIELVGKIDRIDTLKLNDKMYVRVVDYKSSQRDLNLNNIKEGISLQLLTYLATFINEINSNNQGIKAVPAAMNYFTISDKIVSLDDNLSSDEIKSEVIKSLRLRGIFLKDVEILNKMDNKFETQERLIDVSKISISRDTNKLLIESEYENLLKEANNILKQISEEILDGVVKILPNKKMDACKYCDYSSICRKNIKV